MSKFHQNHPDTNLSNPVLRLILEDINCRSNSWWDGDISSKEGINLESTSISHRLRQLIIDSTHILSQSSSCIDLIFIDQPYFAIGSGVHSSLHIYFRHKLIYFKFENCAPAPYQHLVWNYKRGNVTGIRKAQEILLTGIL